jgi:hypothetical protein
MRIRKVERSEVGQKRLAVAGGNLSLVLGSITVGLIVIIAAFFSQGNGSLPANANGHSSSLSSSVFSSSSSTVQPAAQAAAIPYPLVWGPNPVRACSGWNFCIIATLGFADNATLTTITSVTTIIQGNATTILGGSTTTIIRNNGTTYETNPITSYHVDIYALVQDAVTGQNATGPSGPVIANVCHIHPTGFSQCIVEAPFTPVAPSAPHYKVTLFVTSGGLPCTIRIAGLICSSSSQLVAPLIPPVTGDF